MHCVGGGDDFLFLLLCVKINHNYEKGGAAMKQTDEMIKEGNLWGGLYIGQDYEDAHIAVFGIPFDENVSYRKGAKDGPCCIRETTGPIPPTTEYFEDISALRVADLGDVKGESCEDVFAKAEALTCRLVKAGRFFTMIGGDHSVTIPVLRGIDKAVEEPFGIIHIDAHFDLCDTLNGSKVSHGCTERRAVELKHVGKSENIFFIAIRSAEPDEMEFMKENKVNVINAAEFDQIGVDATVQAVKAQLGELKKIYVTVDIDCLDPAYAAGTGTPKFGGITARQLLNLLKGLFENLPVIGFDVVEVAPALDASLSSVYAGQRIITECWGHYYRKNKGKIEGGADGI